MWELFGKLRSTTGGKRKPLKRTLGSPGQSPASGLKCLQKPAGEPFPSTRETPGGHHFPHPPQAYGPGSIDVSFYRL